MLNEKYVICILCAVLAAFAIAVVFICLEIVKESKNEHFYNQLKFKDKLQKIKHLPGMAQEVILKQQLSDLELGQLYHVGTSEIPKDVHKAIKYYELSNEPHADLYLARLYSEGDEKAGILPDAAKAIQYYTQCVNKGMSQCLLDIGDIFAHGLFGDDSFKPDPLFAKRAYLKLMLGTQSKKLKNEAKQRIAELDREFGRQVNDATKDVLEQTKMAEQNGVDTTLHVAMNIVEDPQLMFDDAFRVRNDMNNVHDTFVNRSLLKVTNDLKHQYGKAPTSVALKEIENFVNAYPDVKVRNKAIEVLHRMMQTNTHVVSQNVNEQDGLKLVWNKIKAQAEPMQSNLRETFVKQLADGKEYNHVVCAQGRLSRILDTFAGVDNSHTAAKSKDIIRQEMLAKSSKIRENMMAKMNEGERKVINNPGNEDEMKRSDAFDATYKKTLIDTLSQEYAGITGREFVVDEINSWGL